MWSVRTVNNPTSNNVDFTLLMGRKDTTEGPPKHEGNNIVLPTLSQLDYSEKLMGYFYVVVLHWQK